MKKYKYTNKNVLPIPKYKVGQKVFTNQICYLGDYEVDYTIIKKVLTPRCVDSNDNPHWEIGYRHQPRLNERILQTSIDEECLFETRQEALSAMVEKFKEETISQVMQFKKQFRALGITNINLIELKQ